MKVIIITGQTATGKTNYALNLARKWNGELINCDSRQIYKDLNIITGKDVEGKFHPIEKINNFKIGYYQVGDRTSEVNERHKKTSEVKLTKIWLYDIIEPKQYFSSFDYQSCALNVIKLIIKEGKTPIIVGGTYFYLYHLLYGVETENIPPNFKLRNELESKSVKKLQEILNKVSLQFNIELKSMNDSDWNNPRRLMRKIEVIMHETSEVNELHNKSEKLGIKNLQIEFIGLKFKDKKNLRQAIEKRVEERLKNGAIDEVKSLLKNGYSENDPGLKTIGYQQLILHLKGVINLDVAIQQWITKEIQYAKRQYTFMKKDKNINWRYV